MHDHIFEDCSCRADECHVQVCVLCEMTRTKPTCADDERRDTKEDDRG